MGSTQGRRRIPWRRWNNVIHRDAGYLLVALTVIYAISGIAVNHIHQWNPHMKIVREERLFEPIPIGERDEMVRLLVERLELPGPPADVFRPSPGEVQLFYEDWTVQADAPAGRAIVEQMKERAFLFDFNWLHLNHARGLWTWIADGYAFLLVLVTVTGMFVLRGPKGLTGRGKWWVGAGVAIPVLFLLFARYLG